MIDPKTIEQIKQASIKDRIHIIELILQTLKNDIKQKSEARNIKNKLFKVRKFSLGEELHVDRDILYSERGI